MSSLYWFISERDREQLKAMKLNGCNVNVKANVNCGIEYKKTNSSQAGKCPNVNVRIELNRLKSKRIALLQAGESLNVNV